MPLLSRLIFILALIFSTHISFAGPEETMISSVFKLKTYERDAISGNYDFSGWGSAVMIDSKRIITNAHVILDGTSHPTGYYELCRKETNKVDPVCFSTAKLISYDSIADLALLELSTPLQSTQKLTFSDKTLSIGNSVIVYGFPAIGGSNITRTEGKIGGMEEDKYKFDGTIDHGNSGGGAFGPDGKLVGIPYAVSSDNGVIGYIIPVKILRDFLAGKTDNLEKYRGGNLKEFITFIKKIESIAKNPNLISTKKVEIKDMEKNGFTLKSVNESLDGSIFDYRFLDKKQRVAIVIACSKDASKGKTSIDISQASLGEKDTSTLYERSGSFLDSEKNIYMATSLAKKEKNGSKLLTSFIVSKKSPMCAIHIIADDGMNKDKKSYDVAKSLIKKIQFKNPSPLPPDYSSLFFTLKNIPDYAYITEGISIAGSKISPQIFLTLSSEYSTFADLKIATYESIDDYFNIGYYDEEDLYRGDIKTFQAFYERYRTLDDTRIREEIITTKNGKELIMSNIDASDETKNPPQEKTQIIFFYPFKTTGGEYRAYHMNFEYSTKNINFATTIRSLIESIELPGVSPFSD